MRDMDGLDEILTEWLIEVDKLLKSNKYSPSYTNITDFFTSKVIEKKKEKEQNVDDLTIVDIIKEERFMALFFLVFISINKQQNEDFLEDEDVGELLDFPSESIIEITFSVQYQIVHSHHDRF